MFRGRLISQLGDLPITLGLGGVVNDNSKQLDVGVLAGLGENAVVSLVFRASQESALRALGIVSDVSLMTYAGSAKAELIIPGSEGAFALTGHAEFWNAPGGIILHSDLLSTVTFGGASGFRVTPGFTLTLAGDVTLTGAIGWEQATLNGESGIFAELGATKQFDALRLGVTGWTSPNFGSGAKLNLEYEFDNGTRIGAFVGHDWSTRDHTMAGLRLSVPFGGSAGGGTTPGTNSLGSHLDHVNTTMPGMPITARQKAVETAVHSQPGAVWLFQTVDGSPCSTSEANPGCTFRLDGTRIRVTDDPDYNTTGAGSNDLWYVNFDAAGDAAVFNEFGQFQYLASTADFAGFVAGTTIGVGTTGFYWEDISNGTYWLGQHGVLYSANFGNANYGQAIN